jgi:hypothetical protein
MTLRSTLSPVVLCLLAALAALALPAVSGAADSPEEALWRAAQEGDAAGVRRLLADGVDPDAPARYGVTALGFAAGKGHEEVVRLLLDAGADPAVTDSFYNQTPLGWALSKDETDIALLLVRAGSPGLDDALLGGIRAGHLELVREALGRADYYPWWRTVGLATAEEALEQAAEAAAEEKTARREIARLLRETPVVEELPDVKVPAARLDTLAGAYLGREGEELTVLRRGDALRVRLPGSDEAVALLPVSEQEFRVVGDLDTGVYFFGRGGGPPETVMVMTGATPATSVAPPRTRARAPRRSGRRSPSPYRRPRPIVRRRRPRPTGRPSAAPGPRASAAATRRWPGT